MKHITISALMLFSIAFFYGCSGGITEKERLRVNIDGQYEIFDITISQRTDLSMNGTWAPWILDRNNTTGEVSDHRPHRLENEINNNCLGNIIHLKRLDKTITLSAQNSVGAFTKLLFDAPFFYNNKFVDNWRGDYITSDYYSAQDVLTGLNGQIVMSKRYSMRIEYHRKFWQRLKAPDEIMMIGVIRLPTDESFSFRIKMSKK